MKQLLKAFLPRKHRQALRRVYGKIGTGECGSYRFAHGRLPVDRIALVNHLATVYGLRSYLEIGVRNRNDMLERILCPEREGVDPDPNSGADHVMTSDAFFETYPERRFDLVFIDGDHTGEQVERDIGNSLRALNPGGMILLHDLNPPTAFHAREIYEVDGTFPAWNGTSWQGFAAFRKAQPNLEMYVVDTDWGVGFLRPGRQKLYEGPISSYADLEANRVELLNLISVCDFLRRHPARRRRWTPFDRLIA